MAGKLAHCGCNSSIRKCRPPGSPAGSWPHTPWYHTFFHDKYEAVNVWSHLIPGIFFLCVSMMGIQTGILAYTIFGACAAVTHLCSCAAHVYPDSHSLEKLDHFGITGLILGTTISALIAMQHGGPIPPSMLYASVALAIAAMMRPLARVLGFTLCSVVIVGMHASTIFNWNLGVQLGIYVVAGWCFLRYVQ